MLEVPAASITDLLDAVPKATQTSPGVVQIATPAEVAMGASATKVVTPKAAADGRYYVQADRNGVQRTVPANSWTVVACANEISDTSKVWDASTGFFTAPVTALFRFDGMIRLADGAAADQLGLTFDTVGKDGPYAVWGDRAATGNRFTLRNSRVMMLNAGDQVAMWAYSPSSQRVLSNASISIYRV